MAYPHVTVESHTTKIYWDNFKQVDVELFGAAVRLAIKQCEFFPTVAKIRSLFPEAKGYPALSEVIATINEIVSSGKPWRGSDYHPIVGRIISRLGSVRAIAQMPENIFIKNVNSAYSNQREIEVKLLSGEANTTRARIGGMASMKSLVSGVVDRIETK